MQFSTVLWTPLPWSDMQNELKGILVKLVKVSFNTYLHKPRTEKRCSHLWI